MSTKALLAYDRIIECIVGAPAFVQLSGCDKGITQTGEVVGVDGVTGEFETESTIYYPKDHHAYGEETVVDGGCISNDMIVNNPFTIST